MPLAMEAALYPGLLETFQKNNVLLEQIMKCLESYLETKRVAFPRFYFLSNDELLDILAQVTLKYLLLLFELIMLLILFRRGIHTLFNHIYANVSMLLQN